MAKKDAVTLLSGAGSTTHDTVNVHYRVGLGGENRPDDVMLIQTLFRVIGHDPLIARRRLGVAVGHVPEITGNCDERTRNCIRTFQWTNRNRLQNPYDGMIHPASYENRRVLAAGSRMAIHLLCDFALEGALILSLDQSSLAASLAQYEPRLKCALT